MLTDYSQLNWKPVRDFCFVRELPVVLPGVILPGADLNRCTPVLHGIVEAIGPRVTDMQVGDRVVYEAGAGEFRIPGDDDVRIMHEEDVACVVDQPPAMRLSHGVWSEYPHDGAASGTSVEVFHGQ